MKMSFRQDSLKYWRNIRSLVICMIVITIFYFFSGFIISIGYNLLSFITVPIWRFQASVSDRARSAFSIFKSKQSLEAENENQRIELDKLKFQLQSLELFRKENQDLMVEMGRSISKETSKAIVAVVLSGPNIPPYENLIIDVGRDQGISVGDRVIYQPNIVIGEVGQVFKGSSKVRLYSADSVKTDVMVPVSPPLHAVASGAGGGNFSLELPSSVELSRGMQLLIPGSDIYILGVIDYINIDPITSSQKVLIKYPFNMKNARFVHVIKTAVNEYLE